MGLIRRKKGQIQMFETVAVMLVFFFILAFGFTFYFFIAKAGAQREMMRYQQVQAIKSAQRLSTLPELDCSEGEVRELRCVDLWKVQELTKLLASDTEMREYYWNIFGYTNLTVRSVFPKGDLSYNLYDYPRKRFQGQSFIQIPIQMFNPIEGNSSFGVLEVVYYES